MRKKRYSSYKGELSPEVPNLLARDFHADRPGKKLLTDITEFGIPSGKVYLSPLLDCYDGMVVSCSIGTNPSAELANTMPANGMAHLGDSCNAIIHSDRGCLYRWPGWVELMERHNLPRPAKGSSES